MPPRRAIQVAILPAPAKLVRAGCVVAEPSSRQVCRPARRSAAQHRGDGPAGNCHVLVRPSWQRVKQATCPSRRPVLTAYIAPDLARVFLGLAAEDIHVDARAPPVLA